MLSTQETRLVQGILSKWNTWNKQFDSVCDSWKGYEYPGDDVEIIEHNQKWGYIILAFGMQDDGGPAIVHVHYEYWVQKENVVNIEMMVLYFDIQTSVIVADPKPENGIEEFEIELGE